MIWSRKVISMVVNRYDVELVGEEGELPIVERFDMIGS